VKKAIGVRTTAKARRPNMGSRYLPIAELVNY
jgi:hypothetical protein